MAFRPARTCWTAMLPVRAPSALTNSRSCSWFHSTSAPRRARVDSSTTLPCRATTSSALYVRLTSFQRGLVSQSCWICSALLGVPTTDIGVLLHGLHSLNYPPCRPAAPPRKRELATQL